MINFSLCLFKLQLCKLFFSCVERFLYQSLCTCFFFMFLGL